MFAILQQVLREANAFVALNLPQGLCNLILHFAREILMKLLESLNLQLKIPFPVLIV